MIPETSAKHRGQRCISETIKYIESIPIGGKFTITGITYEISKANGRAASNSTVKRGVDFSVEDGLIKRIPNSFDYMRIAPSTAVKPKKDTQIPPPVTVTTELSTQAQLDRIELMLYRLLTSLGEEVSK